MHKVATSGRLGRERRGHLAGARVITMLTRGGAFTRGVAFKRPQDGLLRSMAAISLPRDEPGALVETHP